MKKSKEHLYTRPLGQLPNDDKVRILSSVTNVDYSLSSNEPSWSCQFFEYADGKIVGGDGVIIKLGSSIIRAAALGSLWKARKNIGFAGAAWPDYLYCDLPNNPSWQEIVYRTDSRNKESAKSLTEFRTHGAVGSLPYVLVPILGNKFADYAIISCFEIYRYYYGYLPSVSRHFFGFDIEGNNPKLFRAEGTGRLDAYKSFQINPLSALTDADQKRIAQYLSSNSARIAIGLAAASARAQALREEPVLPVCRIPVSGINKWEVSARPREVMVEVEGIFKSRRVLTVSRILKCFDERKIDKVLSTREKIVRVKDTDDEEEKTRDGRVMPPKIPGEDIPVVSDQPPGSQVRVTSPDLDADAFVRECWDEVSFTRIGTEREITSIWPKDLPSGPITQASTQTEGGGLIDTGRIEDAPPRPGKSKRVIVDEETFREQLEDIFDTRAPNPISSKEIPVPDLPESLKYLFLSAKSYLDSNGGQLGCFAGGDSKDFFPDIVPIYTLNRLWGKNTVCRAAPDKARRALVLEIPISEGNVYFFDLERKKGEKIGIHVMLFNGVPLTKNQIATIFYHRLEGRKRGWPGRMQFSGEFWSSELYHYDNITDDVKGLLISRCMKKIG